MNDIDQDPEYETVIVERRDTEPKSIINLTTALANVMADIEPITKGGFNQHFRYKFTKMEDLLTEVTPKLAKHGLLIMQSEVGREIKDNLLYATFEFTLLHKSGEVWPDKPRMTGMCRIADNKGGLDDKAMNKCHTAARKYFLLALFQIPTEEDADKDENLTTRGPEPASRQPYPPVGQPDRRKISERAAPVRPPVVPLTSFKIGTEPYRLDPVKGETSRTWQDRYLRAIASSDSPETVAVWRNANTELLQMLEDEARPLFVAACEAETAKQRELSAQRHVDTSEMKRPAPAINPEHFRDDLDRMWSVIKNVEELDDSWKKNVDPVQDQLLPPDLADLSKLWSEHATRIENELKGEA